MINIICCICGKKYDQKEDGRDQVRESHGYCDECFPAAMLDIERQAEELKKDNRVKLELLDPVISGNG